MKLVIEIDEARFKDIQRIASVQLENYHFKTAEQIIANGTPLPETNAGDLISRQALLNAISQKEYGYDYDENTDILGLKYVDIIKGMPSVESEKCEDCISRQAVLEQINCWIGSGEYRYTNATSYLTKRMQDISPVTPKPCDDVPPVEPEKKTGKWHVEGFNVWCTNCGFHPKAIEAFDYCPNCGAKMEVEE